MIVYEREIYRNRSWGMDEGDRHFRKDSAVFKALREIAHKLDRMKISYAIAGGMALDAHGFRRLTVDVAILVARGALDKIHSNLDGRSYVPPFKGSKNLRDVEHGVRIEFLVEGQYPGDGRPKPVAFPDPADVAVEIEGIRYVRLSTLIELKLASGMTAPGRLKDLADVQELIRALDLPADFARELNPYVRARFLELRDDLNRFEDPYEQGGG